MSDKRVWRKIEGFNRYEVSNYGEVKSLYYNKIMAPQDNAFGYKYVTIVSDQRKRKNRYIHRLVAKAFIKNPHSKPHVNHKDFNKANNHVVNLEWVTPKENTDYSFLAGRLPPLPRNVGSKNPRSVFDERDVQIIKKLLKIISPSAIASVFDVSLCAVYSIKKGRAWRHVKD